MIGWLQAKVWQVGTGVATLAAFALAISLAVTAGKLKDARADLERTRDEITKPVTGWAARLATAQTNVATLDAARKTQNAAIEALGQSSAARLAEAERGLSLARRDAAKAEAKVSALMKPLVGADTCLRVIEADARLLESLR